MPRRIVMFVLVALVALVVVGCAQSTAPTQQPAAQQKPAEQPAQKPAAPAQQPAQAQPAPQQPAQPPAQQPAAKPAAPKRGGGVTDASFAEAVSFQPLITNDSASSSYQGLIWAALTRTDPDTLETIGNLYETKPELAADGTTVTWKLRDGVKWSDGKPITAQDVQFSWDKMMDEKTKFPARSFYANSFSKVEAKDARTVVYTLKQPGFCPAVLNSGIPVIPKHVYETLDINQNPENQKPSVVSGLFRVKEWAKDDHVSFNPAYESFVRGQANLDTYNYRIVKDNTVNTQMFKTQEVDFATPDPIDWDELSKLAHAQMFRYYSPAASWTYIGYNLKHPVLGDKKVRQAIAHAVNVQEMVDKIRLGFAKRQFSNITPSSWAYTDDVPKFDYNMDKAKQMLKDAGYTLAGKKLQKDGKDIKLRLHYNAGNKQREQIALITQQALSDLGIEAEVIAEEWNAYLTRVRESKDFDMFVLGWSGGLDPYSTGPIWQSKGSQNYVGYANADVDKWYDEASVVKGCGQADRKAVYAKIQKQIAEDQPYLFLYTAESLVAVNKRVAVNPISKTGFGGIAYQIEKWSITTQEQR